MVFAFYQVAWDILRSEAPWWLVFASELLGSTAPAPRRQGFPRSAPRRCSAVWSGDGARMSRGRAVRWAAGKWARGRRALGCLGCMILVVPVLDFSTSIILIMGNAPCFILFHMCVSFALGNDMFWRIYTEHVGPRSKSKEQLQHLLSCHLALLVPVRLSQLLDFCTLTGSSDYPKPRLLW
jgi:hypothetical protein